MKNIECHYKDGSLVFSTTKSYSYATAHEVLDAFNLVGLNSRIRLKSGESFNVIGRLHVNYDPFKVNHGNWNEVVSALMHTKRELESRVQAL
ncbi:hypothetical protein ASG33_17180 [Dyadobacter sp. Leaf189]|nr:hypothetical protein ASG33_17180 [Dyadobacter sp. Leaf189]